MKRLLALLAAAALVLAAVVVRGLIDSDGPSEPDSGAASSDGDGFQLICGPELLAACNELAAEGRNIKVTSEDEQATVGRIAEGDLEPDGSWAWLAAGEWPEYARAGGADVPELPSSEILARSPAVIVARSERLGALENSCPAPDWGCIGGFAGETWESIGGEPSWGRIEVGLPEPDDGEGMVVVNQAVASEVGTAEFATNDLDDPAVESWFDQLASESNANATSTTPLAEFLRRPGSLSVVGATESEAVMLLDGAAAASSLTVLAPSPVATADVRLFAGSDEALGSVLSVLEDADLTGALLATGWRVPDGDGGYRLPSDADSIGADMRSFDTALPESSGLPAPGVVSAVNTEWENIR